MFDTLMSHGAFDEQRQSADPYIAPTSGPEDGNFSVLSRSDFMNNVARTASSTRGVFLPSSLNGLGVGGSFFGDRL